MAVKAIVVRHKKGKHGRRQKGKWRLVIFHPGWSATASSTSCTTCCTSPPSTWHQIHRRQQKLVWSSSTLGGLLLLHHPLLVLLLLVHGIKYIEDNKNWSGHFPPWVVYYYCIHFLYSSSQPVAPNTSKTTKVGLVICPHRHLGCSTMSSLH